jgi:type I site-specific restriction-modification system R (restriction) subunit
LSERVLIRAKQIEQAILQCLQFVHGYDVENFHTENREDPNDGSNRTIKREVILHDRLSAAALRLNPDIPETAMDAALRILCDRRRAMPMVTANREVHDLIRDGVRVEFRDELIQGFCAEVSLVAMPNGDSAILNPAGFQHLSGKSRETIWLRAECPGHGGAGILPAASHSRGLMP